ncbi:MAG TPA: TIGR02391 family protein [Microbacterium sp.]|nr:TIGR02391 family protein [Microbacterium sp.]
MTETRPAISIEGTAFEIAVIETMTPAEFGIALITAIHCGGRKREWSFADLVTVIESRRPVARRVDGVRIDDEYSRLDIRQRVADGAGWLISRGLIGPASNSSGSTGEWRLTTAGIEALESGDVRIIEASYRLPLSLHPRLGEARALFERGSLQTAVFSATHAVEVRVRELAGYGPEKYGTGLMQEAFNDKTGPLAIGDTPAERTATMQLFLGTVGAFKNPTSHRAVEYDDPSEAADIVQLCDLLLKVAERSASV